jgi:hypothetical protein
MSIANLIPAPYRMAAASALVIALLTASVAATWQVQDWRYAAQLAEQALHHSETLEQLASAATDRQSEEDAKQDALRARLQTSDKIHYSELTDAQKTQARLRDRLATSELRLSVILDANSSGGGGVPPGTGPSGLVHGARRAQLEPAHAQRIVGITNDGDRGLIALRACQVYARQLSWQSTH